MTQHPDDQPPPGVPIGDLARRADQVQQGGARAAVLGVNDGLVSVLCLILGVAGAGSSPTAVRLAGLAGLLAGAVSMAAGEWISVTAQVELFKGVLKELRGFVRSAPDALASMLAASLRKAGFSGETAQAAAREAAATEESLFAVSARRIVGIDPGELGSPWTAAISSFALFTVGGLVPVLPWFFAGGTGAVIASIAGTGLAGLGVGAVVARSSGRNIVFGALRQLLIVLLAAVVTYYAGTLVG
ncbi:VIT1/CCC1 transporter family protein [Nonomuraea sp. NPDC050310]|uniref:VIT1/CCC1 transporter family protein n=1 Tax=Nonomuraea sp. NPDC050310 TaxID=3154935 RepID=UPI00340F1BD9